MDIAFTLCSINYLGQAQTLCNSLRRSNPGLKFIIGLVDKNVHNVDLSFLGCEILEVDKLSIEGFEEMVQSYSIVELVTAVKPYYFTYLFNKYLEVSKIAYFDPDIMVFDTLGGLSMKLDQHDIILTPHLTQPITDTFLPTEKHLFNTGVFNLGFLAVKRSENTLNMLTWWSNKLRRECILDLSRGLFVDQLWMNLVPAYFEKVLIDKYCGYNMAHWNLHEREITGMKNGYQVNGESLVFYHFSHYHPAHPQEIAAFHTRYSFDTRPDLRKLYDDYREELIQNHYFELKKVPCYYMRNEKKKRIKKSILAFFRRNLPLSLKIRLKPLLKGVLNSMIILVFA